MSDPWPFLLCGWFACGWMASAVCVAEWRARFNSHPGVALVVALIVFGPVGLLTQVTTSWIDNGGPFSHGFIWSLK